MRHVGRRCAGHSCKFFTRSAQTTGSDNTLLVDAIHGLVPRIPWHLHLVVLNHVLLNNGVASGKCAGLFDSKRVEVGLGDEAIVSGNVSCGLGRAHS